jgi:4'-phosphopantetheinyl transferase EntD
VNGRPRLLTQKCDARFLDRHAHATRWLSPAEQDEFTRLRAARRRGEWLAGRWLIKGMLQRRVAEDSETTSRVELCEIEILSRDALGRGQPPRVVLAGRLLPWHLSLAHHSGIVWGAVSTDADLRVGIDVVPAEPIDLRADDLWFTPAELRWLRRSNDRLLGATLWSVKEAVYKATNRGEPFIPARIEVSQAAAGGFRWSRDGRPCGTDDALHVRQSGENIVAVASVREAGRDD